MGVEEINVINPFPDNKSNNEPNHILKVCQFGCKMQIEFYIELWFSERVAEFFFVGSHSKFLTRHHITKISSKFRKFSCSERNNEKVDLHTEINNEYFLRIEEINYTINQGDGQSIQGINRAAIILVGILGTSKSPASMYLAYPGYKVANIPFVSLVHFYIDLAKLKNKLTIGVTIDVSRLIEFCKNRLTLIDNEDNNTYANPEKVEKEIRGAEELFKQNN
ncbi:putative pyruvate, phosphate dikinase regulatory protein [Calliopsis andreniformis]|uniref:putative pyruvate, phosphate dikinase regulatory protein n=1 Tax=Calliopsis andreniformis TaxID=337506 RepID=UPI003FCE6DDF